MPEFANPYVVLNGDGNISQEELIRLIRFAIASEFEAIQIYNQIAQSTDNALAKAVFLDIANEEKVHTGELLQLMRELDSDEFVHYEKGYKEVEEIIEEVEKHSPKGLDFNY